VIDYIINSVTGTLMDYDSTPSQPEFGTTAHLDLEDKIEEDFQRFKKRAEKKGFVLNGIEVKSEVFRNPDKSPGRRRGKGTVGLDVVILHKGTPVLAFDLKTGKGWSPAQITERKRRFGSSIIQITVKPLPRR
jgi:hypothetical protein